jgi:hypothetical protein
VATHFDRVIPPGGTGKVTLKIDGNRVIGEFHKKAIVWSNDPIRRSIALYLKGEVRPHISVEPGGYVSLWGTPGQVPPGHLDIINNHKKPIKIIRIDTDRPDRIKWRLRETKPGFVYRLEVEDIPKTAATYTGHLKVRTNNPKKPELTIIVNGDIRAKEGS